MSLVPSMGVLRAMEILSSSIFISHICPTCLYMYVDMLTVFFLCLQVLTFYFPDCGKLAPPVVQVQTMSFSYGTDKVTS